MRKTAIIGLVIVVVLGGLYMTMIARRPKAPKPTTSQIWASEGIPVEIDRITSGDMEQTVEVTGDITALNKVTLSAKISGRVAMVNAREGDPISAGQIVIRLDQQDLLSSLQQARGGLESAIAKLSQSKTNSKVTKIQTDSAIEQAQAQLNSAKAQLAVVKKPNRSQEQMVAENAVASTKANLDAAESNYKRNKQLLKEGAISASSFDTVEAQYKVALAQYKSSQDQLSLIKEGGRSENVTSAQAQVRVALESLRAAKANSSQNLLRKEDIRQSIAALDQARAAVAIAEQQLSYSYVKSPISGSLSSRLTEPGQVVSAGQALGEVVNLGSLYFKGEISEKELDNVSKGQTVKVRIDAIPGVEFQGIVSEMYPSGSILSRNFPVRINIKSAGNNIKPGMFARGEIVTGISKNILLVPKDAVDERKGTQSVFTVTSNKTVKRHIVTVLRENRNYAQIQTPNDLKLGDIVVTQGRQNLQEGSKIRVENGK